MNRTLREHIVFLEERLMVLHRELMDSENSLDERNRIEAEIRVANMALEHYRKALELEKQLT